MEFWDALEDSQYLDAVASVRDGPKPICKWDVPTDEQLVEWETRVRARQTTSTQQHPEDASRSSHHPTNNKKKEEAAAVELLSLDWYVSSPIGLFFFSSFVKEQFQKQAKKNASSSSENNNGAPENGSISTHPNTTTNQVHNKNPTAATKQKKTLSALADQHAFVRMNFVEDLLRFQTMAQTNETQTKQVFYGKRLLHYLRQPPTTTNLPSDAPATTATSDDHQQHDDEKSSDGSERSSAAGPPLTLIRECDLKLPRRTVPSRLGCKTPSEVDAAVALNLDPHYTSNTVGLKGPLLHEFVQTLNEWIDAHDRTASKKSVKRAESDSVLHREEQLSKREESHHHPGGPLSLATEVSTAAAAATMGTEVRVLRRGQTDPNDEHDDNNNLNTTSSSHHPAQHYAIHPPTEAVSVDPIVQKVEAIVYESLKRDYGDTFQSQTTKQYNRMRDFLWYQDRRVVYEDFYVMRVLGRGGFGLVSGTFRSIGAVFARLQIRTRL